MFAWVVSLATFNFQFFFEFDYLYAPRYTPPGGGGAPARTRDIQFYIEIDSLT